MSTGFNLQVRLNDTQQSHGIHPTHTILSLNMTTVSEICVLDTVSWNHSITLFMILLVATQGNVT